VRNQATIILTLLYTLICTENHFEHYLLEVGYGLPVSMSVLRFGRDSMAGGGGGKPHGGK
jgi:hypothetical protein